MRPNEAKLWRARVKLGQTREIKLEQGRKSQKKSEQGWIRLKEAKQGQIKSNIDSSYYKFLWKRQGWHISNCEADSFIFLSRRYWPLKFLGHLHKASISAHSFNFE
jgi:hypothetical protein